MSTIKPPFEWISHIVVSFIGMIIISSILMKEYKKRKSENVIFTTKWLKLLSILIMMFAVLFCMIRFIEYWSPFCYISIPLQYWLAGCPAIICGFYQLSRLYYCFSNSQIHSNKGYPNWLFIIMYTLGIFLFTTICIYPWFFYNITSKCGINNHYQYFSQNPKPQNDPFIALLVNLSVLIYIIWDIVTLILYTVKVWSFRRFKTEQIDVYNRIMSILQRILILTVLYETSVLFIVIMGFIRDQTSDINSIWIHLIEIIYQSSWIFGCVVGCYSIFLMQQHNNDEYKQFLQILYWTKLYYICCCCKSIFTDEKLADNVSNHDNRDKNMKKHIDDTIWETHDISVKNEHSVPEFESHEITMTAVPT